MRAAAAVVGMGVLAAVWLLPLHGVLPGHFAVHMVRHMSVVAIAAPLIAVAVAGTTMDPARRYPVLLSPVSASVLELLVVWAWHAPALHLAASGAPVWRVVEQGSFLLVGLALWIAVLGGEPEGGRLRAGSAVIALLLVTMHMTLLGALLTLAPRPLYDYPASAGDKAVESALHDQQVGGSIMLVVGGASLLIGGLWLSRRMLGGARRMPAERAGVGS